MAFFSFSLLMDSLMNDVSELTIFKNSLLHEFNKELVDNKRKNVLIYIIN